MGAIHSIQQSYRLSKRPYYMTKAATYLPTKPNVTASTNWWKIMYDLTMYAIKGGSKPLRWNHGIYGWSNSPSTSRNWTPTKLQIYKAIMAPILPRQRLCLLLQPQTYVTRKTKWKTLHASQTMNAIPCQRWNCPPPQPMPSYGTYKAPRKIDDHYKTATLILPPTLSTIAKHTAISAITIDPAAHNPEQSMKTGPLGKILRAASPKTKKLELEGQLIITILS